MKFFYPFLPLLWIPVVFNYSTYFFKHKRGSDIYSLYTFHWEYSQEIFLFFLILGLCFSIYKSLKLDSKIKWLIFGLVLLSAPLQYTLYIASSVQALGK